MKTEVLLELQNYRYVIKGTIELNGKPDYRLQKKEYYSRSWKDEYLFDNQAQCLLAMEDFEYTKWLCGDNAYVRDVITAGR